MPSPKEIRNSSAHKSLENSAFLSDEFDFTMRSYTVKTALTTGCLIVLTRYILCHESEF